jgi:hypothetical protein
MLYLLADDHCLFRRNELEKRFDGWTIGIVLPDIPCPGGHAQRFFDHDRGEGESKELKSFKPFESRFIVS